MSKEPNFRSLECYIIKNAYLDARYLKLLIFVTKAHRIWIRSSSVHVATLSDYSPSD
jgi:hypothetical protein